MLRIQIAAYKNCRSTSINLLMSASSSSSCGGLYTAEKHTWVLLLRTLMLVASMCSSPAIVIGCWLIPFLINIAVPPLSLGRSVLYIVHPKILKRVLLLRHVSEISAMSIPYVTRHCSSSYCFCFKPQALKIRSCKRLVVCAAILIL